MEDAEAGAHYVPIPLAAGTEVDFDRWRQLERNADAARVAAASAGAGTSGDDGWKAAHRVVVCDFDDKKDELVRLVAVRGAGRSSRDGRATRDGGRVAGWVERRRSCWRRCRRGLPGAHLDCGLRPSGSWVARTGEGGGEGWSCRSVVGISEHGAGFASWLERVARTGRRELRVLGLHARLWLAGLASLAAAFPITNRQCICCAWQAPGNDRLSEASKHAGAPPAVLEKCNKLIRLSLSPSPPHAQATDASRGAANSAQEIQAREAKLRQKARIVIFANEFTVAKALVHVVGTKKVVASYSRGKGELPAALSTQKSHS